MVSEGKGRFFRREDGKYLIYVPVYLAEDSMFPFKGSNSIPLKGEFTVGQRKLEFTKTPIKGKETKEKTVAGSCRLFKRKDDKYLVYVSKYWAEDSQFPFRADSVPLKVSFKPGGDEKLVVEDWTTEQEND